MDSSQLKQLALRSRSMRETGMALLIMSLFLGLFLFIPLGSKEPPRAPVAVASIAPDAFAHVAIEAKAAIVYDLAMRETLYAKNANAQLPLASLTKLLTVYAALAEFPPDTLIAIPADAARLDAPRAFSTGQTFSLADLSRLTLTASLNDGAAAIASATAERQNRPQSEMLAGAAAALNLPQTYAINGSGLDASATISGGYGSAHDLAILAGALFERAPDIAEATTQSSAQAMSKGGTSFTVMNTDPMIDAIPQLLLSKTGYTDLAGGNLAIVFDIGINHPIAVVVLGSSAKARFTDGTALIAASLAHFAGIASL
jgi:D-alanyl-D-alanine carboxypeptidase